MLNPTMAFCWLALFFGCTALIIFLTVRNYRDGSLLVRQDRHEMVFRSRQEAIFAKVIGFLLVLVLGLPLIALEGPELRPILGLVVAVTLAQLAFLTGRMPGLKMLTLDLDRRTYRYRGGTLLRASGRSGTWDDLADVYVRRFSSSRGYNGYQVFVGWRDGDPDHPMLGMFGRSSDADRLAAEVAGRLDREVADAPTPIG